MRLCEKKNIPNTCSAVDKAEIHGEEAVAQKSDMDVFRFGDMVADDGYCGLIVWANFCRGMLHKTSGRRKWPYRQKHHNKTWASEGLVQGGTVLRMRNVTWRLSASKINLRWSTII